MAILDWHALLPHPTGGFTCHLPSWRGRGLSGDHPDLSLGRIVDDIIAYVDSIGGDRTGELVPRRQPGIRRGGTLRAHEGPTPDDPVVLGAISTPVLVLHGSDTKPRFIASARQVADRVPSARIREISGAGHAAPSMGTSRHRYPIHGAVHRGPEPVDDIVYRRSSSPRPTRTTREEQSVTWRGGGVSLSPWRLARRRPCSRP